MEQKELSSAASQRPLELTSWKEIAHHLDVHLRTAQKRSGRVDFQIKWHDGRAIRRCATLGIVIIAADSVLIKIPSAMSRKQALFIEGIRYSMETADVAHVRLQATLPLLTKGDQLLPEDRLTASAMLDAWAIVDSLHRLRGLLSHMPGIQKRDRKPPIRAFLDATDQVTELRNTIQHLDTTIPGILDDHNWACSDR